MFKGVTLPNCALLIEPYLQNLGTYMFLGVYFFRDAFFFFFFQTNLITKRIIVLNVNDFFSFEYVSLEALDVNKQTSSGSYSWRNGWFIRDCYYRSYFGVFCYTVCLKPS